MVVLRGGGAIILKVPLTTNVSVARILTEVRDNISEPDAEYFPDDRLLRWINRAHERTYDTVGMIFKRYFGTTSTIDTVKDQERYDLPNDFKRIMFIRRVKSGTQTLDSPPKLEKIDYQDKETYRFGGYIGESYYIYENQIGLLPVPVSSEMAAIEVEYIPLPVELTTTGNIVIPPDYAELVVLYASFSALRAEDESKGHTFLRDYKDRTNEMLLDYNKRDEAHSDVIRSTDWNDEI